MPTARGVVADVVAEVVVADVSVFCVFICPKIPKIPKFFLIFLNFYLILVTFEVIA